MSRTLTQQHLRKMHEARARAHARRRRDQERATREYINWLSRERDAYAGMLRAREVDGADAARRAEDAWRLTLAMMPPLDTLPGDHDPMWGRIRGELRAANASL